MIAGLLAFALAHASWAVPLLTGGGGLALAVARWGVGGLIARARAQRGWLTLLAVAGAAAVLWAMYSGVRAERDRAFAWRERVCASAGIDTRAPAYRRGDCSKRILRLAALERETLTISNQAMAASLDAARASGAADLAAATAAARVARDAALKMEEANAQVGPDDRVARDWFVALNRAGGLRTPGS